MKKVVKFRTQFDPSYKETPGISIKGESMTEPDQHLPLRQLVINHTRNIGTNVKHYEGIHTEHVVAPNYEESIDRIEHKRSLDKQAKELDQQAKSEIKQKQDEKQEKEAQKPTGKTTDDTKEVSSTKVPSDPKGDTRGSTTD